jgi:hypothetical protein
MPDSQFRTEIANEKGSMPTTAAESTDQHDNQPERQKKLIEEVAHQVANPLIRSCSPRNTRGNNNE